MLVQLAKRDKDWRRMALQICGDKMLADDLVQDMYLKFANYQKELNDFYMFFAIKSIFLDQIKKQKLNISSIEIESISIKDDEYCFEKDKYEADIINRIESLPYFERETALVSQTISQRELARQTEIPFVTINKTIKNTKLELKLWAQKRR